MEEQPKDGIHMAKLLLVKLGRLKMVYFFGC
jgi:hypothetical protein